MTRSISASFPKGQQCRTEVEARAERAARAEGWTKQDSRFTRQGVSIAYVDWETLCREEGVTVTGVKT